MQIKVPTEKPPASISLKPHIQQSSFRTGAPIRDHSDPGEIKHIYKLGSNENPLGPSPAAVSASRTQLPTLNAYPHQDDTRFCKSLAHGVHQTLNEDQFLPANGTLELLDLICRAFLEPGDECIICPPTFL